MGGILLKAFHESGLPCAWSIADSVDLCDIAEGHKVVASLPFVEGEEEPNLQYEKANVLFVCIHIAGFRTGYDKGKRDTEGAVLALRVQTTPASAFTPCNDWATH